MKKIASSGKYVAYPEYKDSGVEWIDKLPVHWEESKLRYMFSFSKGLTITKANLQDKGVACVNYGEVHSKYGFEVNPEVHALKCVSENYLKTDLNALLNKGDIVFADTSEDIEGSGNFTQLVSDEDVFAGYHTIIARPNDRQCSRFYAYLLESLELRTQIRHAVKGVKVFSITQAILRGINIWLPSLNEREKIANFLDHETAKIDSLIEKQQQLIKLLKEKRQAVISHAVTKGLNSGAAMKDSGAVWLGEVPEHWKVCRIKQIAKLASGHTPDKKKEEYWINCEIPWVSLNDSTQLKQVDYITNTSFYLNKKGLENSSAKKLPKRCVVFTRDASIGLAAITTRTMAVSQHVIAWICDENETYPEYLLLVFYAMKDELDRYTAGATLKTIGMPDVNKLTAAFPKIDEQKIISEYTFKQMKKFDLLISKAEKAIELIKERRTALISAVVTGKNDVRHWQAPATSISTGVLND
jgi:type I restriction enzyme S subunit